jgi:hypothetical protein
MGQGAGQLPGLAAPGVDAEEGGVAVAPLAVLLDPLGDRDPQVGDGGAVTCEAELGSPTRLPTMVVWLSAPAWTPSMVRLVVCVAAASARSMGDTRVGMDGDTNLHAPNAVAASTALTGVANVVPPRSPDPARRAGRRRS